jgi:hypothetical protein
VAEERTRTDGGGEEENGPFPPTAELLRSLRESGEDGRLSLGEIAEATQGRAFGLVLLVLAIPETIPMIGLSAILATPIVLIGVFMLWTGEEGRLPGWLARRSIDRSLARRGIDRAIPLLERMDRVARPRWGPLARASRLQGAVCVVMGVVLAIPMPGVNILAAFAVAGVGLGILQRDGMLVAAALLSGALALAGFVAVVTGAAAVLERLL